VLEAAVLPATEFGLTAAEAFHHEKVIESAVPALTSHLCSRHHPGIAAACQKQLQQQGELVLGGIEAAVQDEMAGPEQLQQWAQQLQQFAAAAAAAVPFAAA
jgi:hypothetical protein